MRTFRIYIGLIILLVATGTMFGQGGATGSILGTVTDSTGAVMPGVKVTVTNTGTNVSFHTVTSSAGDYLAPSLDPGTYSVSAVAKDFQKATTTVFTLAVDQKARVNLSMTPGAVTSTVEVQAQTVALDTDSEALSQEMSQQQVEQLPLNGRNFMQLLLVTAGAVTVGGEQGSIRMGEGNAMSINGGRPEGNNYTLDGLVDTDQAYVTPAVILSQDAIQEFKVESGTYSAEYGFSASQINIVSKGGTNKLHGSIFEFNRNNAYDAKPFATATDYQAGRATVLPVLRQNQFGFVADGPVYIPKLYDGRNKTFWMANYEGWRIDNGSNLYATTPNPATLTGDFSAETYAPIPSAGLPGGPLPAFGTADCTTLLSLGLNCMPVDPTTGQPFPNNQLPTADITNRLALVANKYGFFPAPNLGNKQPEGVNNFIQSVGMPLTSNQQTYRVDQALGKLGSVFFRYTYSNYQDSSLGTASLADGMGFLTQFEVQKDWAVSHTISLGSANVNNFRFGYLDAQSPTGNSPASTPPAAAVSALGETGVFTTFTPLQLQFPTIGLSQYSTFGGDALYTGSDSPAWEFADSFTSVHGKHTLGLGIDYRRWHLIANHDEQFLGSWSFGAANVLTNSANCPNSTGLCGTGNAVADLLLGYYSSAVGNMPGPLSPTNQAGNPQDHVFSYFAPYAEDDWKVTQKLTLNLGMRWDYRAAAYEASNHFFWRDTTNTEGGLCYADPTLSTDGVAPGVGVNGGPILRYCGSVPHPGLKTPFAPRFGLAYRLNDKTVVRGGYGIFFDSSEGVEIGDSADIYPYAVRNSLTPTQNSAIPKFGNDLFPNYTTLGPFPESSLSFLAVIESENPLDPYVQSWTGSIERELARNTTLEVNYIGTHAVHLLDRRNIAQPNSIPATDLPYCQANPADVTHNCPTSSRLPYPNFNGFYIDSDFHGYSHYNAMNIKFEHRAGDLAATAIYTWAKSMDDKSAAAGVGATGSGYQGFMDNHNPTLDYGPSDFAADQRFVASYIYQLPIGRGKKIAGGVSRTTDLLVGGWQITGITTFQAGFPFSISASDASGLLDSQFQRANITPGCNVHGSLTGKFQRLNMSCFTQPAIGVYGSTTRNFLRQPGMNDWDMGFGKGFNLTERVRFGLHVDTFNTFNHHQYAYTVGGMATGGSGGGSSIDNTVGDTLAGQITASGVPRVLQLCGKITF
jgi:hypothetical protein